MDVANYIHYDLAEFQHEIPCCVGSGKKTNFGRKSDTLPNMDFLLFFLPRTEYKVFQIRNLQDSTIYSWLH
jgi:hypothetical protein